MNFTRFASVLRGAATRFTEDGCPFLAQAIAFNALFAVFPIVFLIIATMVMLYGEQAGQTRAIALIGAVAPGFEKLLTSNLKQIVNLRGLSGVISVVALVWSGKNLFMALAYALDRALGVPKGRPLIHDIAMSLVMLPILGIILIAATTIPVTISLAAQHGLFQQSAVESQVVGYAMGTLLVFVITALLYHYLPNRRVALMFGIPGAVFTAIAWEIAQIAFAMYTMHVDFSHVYGTVSAIAILLLWFYYMGIIFLFGAQISAQWSLTSEEPLDVIEDVWRPA